MLLQEVVRTCSHPLWLFAMLKSLHHRPWRMHKMHWTKYHYISLQLIYLDALWYCPIPRNAEDVQCTWCRWSKFSCCGLEVKTRQSRKFYHCILSVHRTHFLHPTATLHKPRVHLLGRVDSNFALVVRHAMPMDHSKQFSNLYHHKQIWMLCFCFFWSFWDPTF